MKKITRTVLVEEVTFILYNENDGSVEYKTVDVLKAYTEKERKQLAKDLFPDCTLVRSEPVAEREIMCSMPLDKFFDMANKTEIEEWEEE